jgi:Holliday junction DNA helicase RuvA
MYSYIEGRIVEKNPAYLVLDNNGIGYLINISLNTFSKIKDIDSCKLFIHHAIKNEATTPVGFVMFGFAEEQERTFFRQLISVSGVGNTTALLMLSSLTAEKLYHAITQNQPALLQSVKGIGAKSAQRIIIDLKDKLEKGNLTSEFIESQHNTSREEALSGLNVLGFNKAVAERAINKVFEQRGTELAVEELIKESLKLL